MKKGDTVLCADVESSTPLLEQKQYVVESVSMCGYIWLVEPKHKSGRVGPYVQTRFVNIDNL